MADYHTTYKGLEGDTTQWEDIHRKLGNLPPKPAPHKPAAYEPEAEEVRDSKWLGGKAEEELEELEDDFKDEHFLERYRQQRLKQMQEMASKPRFGTMELIRGSEFLAQVTNAGEGFYVVVFLFKEGVPGCTVLEGCLNDLAGRYPHTKFVRIISTDCIPNYPDSQLPTVILYREADLVAHMAGLAAFGGKRTTPQQVALALNQHGPVCGSGANANEDDAGEQQHLQEAALRGLVEQLVLDRERRQLSSGDEDSDFD